MTKKDQNSWKYWQFFWRSWAIQASWNYERQMNMGFMYGIAPIIDKIYDKPEDKQRKSMLMSGTWLTTIVRRKQVHSF